MKPCTIKYSAVPLKYRQVLFPKRLQDIIRSWPTRMRCEVFLVSVHYDLFSTIVIVVMYPVSWHVDDIRDDIQITLCNSFAKFYARYIDIYISLNISDGPHGLVDTECCSYIFWCACMSTFMNIRYLLFFCAVEDTTLLPGVIQEVLLKPRDRNQYILIK